MNKKGVVLMAQPQTEVFVDDDGAIVICQPSSDQNFNDANVYIDPANVPRMVEALQAAQVESLAKSAVVQDGR